MRERHIDRQAEKNRGRRENERDRWRNKEVQMGQTLSITKKSVRLLLYADFQDTMAMFIERMNVTSD